MNMNTRTTSQIALLSLFAGLAPAGAVTLRPRPLGFMAARQVPLLADPNAVGDILPLDLPGDKTASAAAPDDETVQALRESGLSAAQIREVALNSRAWKERLAKRDSRAPGVKDEEEVAKKGKARRLKLPFGRK